MREITACHYVMGAVVVVGVAVGIACAGCSPRPVAAAAANAPAALEVAVARVAMADIASGIESGGVVEARTTATISSRLIAPVRAVLVSPGDQVRKGQTLIVLDSHDLAAGAAAARSAALAAEQGVAAAVAEHDAAQARLVLAQASHDRIAALHAKRSATAQELDDAVAMLRNAQAGVASASAHVLRARSVVDSAQAASDQASTTAAFATITAPFDGTVTDKMVEPGNMASPGMPLMRLEDTRSFRLEVRVDESRIGHVKSGDRVPVVFGNSDTPIVGTVSEISRSVDADARAFLVKVDLPNVPGLRSGEFGKARFHGASRRALTVPLSAIVHRGQLTTVFVVDNGVARVRLVNLSDSEVLAGLTDQDVVIVSPSPAITDGRRVTAGGR